MVEKGHNTQNDRRKTWTQRTIQYKAPIQFQPGTCDTRYHNCNLVYVLNLKVDK